MTGLGNPNPEAGLADIGLAIKFFKALIILKGQKKKKKKII
jgi:hypothetical protein